MKESLSKNLLGVCLLFLGYLSQANQPELLKSDNLIKLKGVPLEFSWSPKDGKLIEIRHVESDAQIIKGSESNIELFLKGGKSAGSYDADTGLKTQDKNSAKVKKAPLRLESVTLDLSNEKFAKVTITQKQAPLRIVKKWTIDKAKAFAYKDISLIVENKTGKEIFNKAVLPLGEMGSDLFDSTMIVPTWPPVRKKVRDYKGEHKLSSYYDVTGISVSGLRSKWTVAFGHYWDKEWSTFGVKEQSDKVKLHSEYECEGYYQKGVRIPFGGQFISVSEGDWKVGLKSLGKAYNFFGFKAMDHPEWSKKMIMYLGSILGVQYKAMRSPQDSPPAVENFKNLRLDTLEYIGINTLWLLPVYPGGYGMDDYYSVNPLIGKMDGLKELAKAVKEHHMRLMFDLVPHGPGVRLSDKYPQNKKFIEAHSDYFAKNPDGSYVYWKGAHQYSGDYLSRGWQDFVADSACYWTKELGLSGFRVDTCRGDANWSAPNDRLPSWSTKYGGLKLVERLNERLTEINPDNFILAEMRHPMMLSKAHAIYDERLLLAMWDIVYGGMPIEDWVSITQQYMEYRRLAFPVGSGKGLMRFVDNNNFFPAQFMFGPGMIKPLRALCFFVEGYPLIMQNEEIGYENFLRNLSLTRTHIPELCGGEADYLAARCKDRGVFSFIRTEGKHASLIAINFSPLPRKTKLTCDSLNKDFKWAKKFPSNELVNLDPEGKEISIDIQLPPWGWEVVALRGQKKDLPIIVYDKNKSLHVASGEYSPEARIVFTDAQGQKTSRNISSKQDAFLNEKNGKIESITINVGSLNLKWHDGLLGEVFENNDKILKGMSIHEAKKKFLTKLTTTEWSIKSSKGEIIISYKAESENIILNSKYSINSKKRVTSFVELKPKSDMGKVKGKLTMALMAPETPKGILTGQSWTVHTIEGDKGGPFNVKHPAAKEHYTKWEHPTQRLWDGGLFPLSLTKDVIEWRIAKCAIGIKIQEKPNGAELDNIYLTEYAPDGKPGMTLNWAWSEGKWDKNFSPASPFKARFVLNFAPHKKEDYSSKNLPVSFSADGPNWHIANKHYKLRVTRSKGGSLTGLWLNGEKKNLISETSLNAFGDISKGIPHYEAGKPMRYIASASSYDVEPDCWIVNESGNLKLTFRGVMRRENRPWLKMTPRTYYETSYVFDKSPAIKVSVKFCPIAKNIKLKNGGMEYRISTKNTKQCEVKPSNFKFRLSDAENVWKWKDSKVPLKKLSFDLTAPRGAYSISNINPLHKDGIQNISTLQTGSKKDIIGLSTVGGNNLALSFIIVDKNSRELKKAWYGLSFEINAKKQKKTQSKTPVLVLNKGIGGQNTTVAFRRFERDVLKVKPNYLIIYLGMNDAVNSHALVPIEKYKKNLSKMIGLAQNHGISVLLVSLNPIIESYVKKRHSTHPEKNISAFQKKYDMAVRGIASERNIPLIDLRKLLESHTESLENKSSLLRNEANSKALDGVHLTAEGYREFAKLFEPFFKNRIKPGDVVVCFGDSLTYGAAMKGAGTAFGDTYPAWLSVILNRLAGTGNASRPLPPKVYPSNKLINGDFEIATDRVNPDLWKLQNSKKVHSGRIELCKRADEKNYLRISSGNEDNSVLLINSRLVSVKNNSNYCLSYTIKGKGEIIPRVFLYEAENCKGFKGALPPYKKDNHLEASENWTEHKLKISIPEMIKYVSVSFRVFGNINLDNIDFCASSKPGK